MKEVLRIQGLAKAYGDNIILENFNLCVAEHEFLCILGPSGCGKSTLLRCIAGFEPYEGSIECNGHIVKKPSTERIMVFQDYNQLFPWKTVESNIQYPLTIQGVQDREELERITNEVLEKVGLDGVQKYYPHELSGGMKQRVAIARALALKPQIILMDEPFAALDAITRNRLQGELYEISTRERMTVLFITHNIQEAITLGTRILMIGQRGQIVIDETNTMEHPVRPSNPGYGALWDRFSKTLQEQLFPKECNRSGGIYDD